MTSCPARRGRVAACAQRIAYFANDDVVNGFDSATATLSCSQVAVDPGTSTDAGCTCPWAGTSPVVLAVIVFVIVIVRASRRSS